ncbi:MAG: aspartate carbamoyltransferase catalytic subunit [Pseudomonadota bacterium]
MDSSEAVQKHFLNLDELSTATLQGLIARALDLLRGAAPQSLDATIANLFFEPSTRTRVSFELAAHALNATVTNIELDRSSATKGETLEDTAATLAAMGVDALVVRHPESGGLEALREGLLTPIHLINAGDGNGRHPSQALLDAATLEASGLDWPNATLAIVGDLRHSRVARSGLSLFKRLGLGEVRLAGPENLLPDWGSEAGMVYVHSLEDAVRNADAVMMLRVQHERMDQEAWPDPASYARDWCLTSEHLRRARPGCRVLHPGPINRGMEIDPSVADGDQSLILDQVRMGVFARMAIFEWLLA